MPATAENTPCSQPFPPPALEGIPTEYVLEQLRRLAPTFWGNAENANCTVVIPIHRHQFKSIDSTPIVGYHPLEPSMFVGEAGPGRRVRASAPALNLNPRVPFKLHTEYLSYFSPYLRGLFGGANPMDLIAANASAPNETISPPSNRMPHLLPSASGHPILYLPVPDPSSIYLLFHWMYYGDTRLINQCLHRGKIQWEGIARNVEYLRLGADIKMFLSAWYTRWLAPVQEAAAESDSDDASSDNTTFSESDSEDEDELFYDALSDESLSDEEEPSATPQESLPSDSAVKAEAESPTNTD